MNSPAVKGQRQFIRIPFSAQVRLWLDEQCLEVRLVDIALKGALVHADTSSAVALHDPCRLELFLAPGNEGIVMTGRIAHIDAPHLGIECQDIDVTSLTRLRRLLALNLGDADLMDRQLSRLFGVA